MAFLADSQKLTAAQQIKNWNDSVISSLDNIEVNKAQLVTQLEAMKVNNDYTASDISEVQYLLTAINTRISEL
jgi:hypothetical protein